MATITDLLAATGAKHLAIVAHGEPGVVHLGKTPLNLAQIQAQAELLQSWGVDEIALYSCELAQGDLGQDFVYQLSELTGATVAAAATKTGNRSLGGSWDLSVTTGVIAAPRLFDASSLELYPAVLAVSFRAATNFGLMSVLSSVTVGDFNGDGKLDLATANSGIGDVSVLLNTSPTIMPYVKNDFNSDGKTDILWRNDNGNVALWQMDGKTVTNSPTLATAVPTAWQIAGSGDFNGDRSAEILWRNTTDGSISIGQYSPQTAPSIVGADPLTLQVAGTGDFNRDKKSDILWRNTANGDVTLWQMNGTASTSQSVVGNAAASWKIAGNADFNGDGKADILWRNDSGAVAMWEMNGATIANASLTSTPLVDNSWKIAAPIL